jgi:alpha-tubulin suppressor-like RCC1 family protein
LPTGGATAIVAGGDHTCAVINGNVWCWGGNTNGELGSGNNSPVTGPVQVFDRTDPANPILLSGVFAIAAGTSHSCAVVANSQVMCWGKNLNGQLGDGSNIDRSSPVTVQDYNTSVPITGVRALAAGAAHTCALINGGVQCWGANAGGQLGDGGTSDHPKAFTASVYGDVQRIAAGDAHTCAILDGGVWCWGLNDDGELGNCLPQSCSYQSKSLPQLVTGLSSGAVSIAAHGGHTCALVDSEVKCWGLNANGQLGNGSTTSMPFPVYPFTWP